jgi:hypothetical protein
MKALSDSLPKLTREIFSKKFVSLARILAHWDDIVGRDMAVKAQPAKLHYRKAKIEGEKSTATLDIAVSSADAALLHYQKDLILERMNQIFGERWITGIKFVHVAANLQDKNPTFSSKTPSPAEETAFLEFLAQIEDEDLRKRLEKMGSGVLRRLRAK